jgi:hypothetical protein
MTVERQNVYGCLIVGVLAGVGCGELGTQPTSTGSPVAQQPGQVRTQSASLDGEETDIEAPTAGEHISKPEPGLVERVDFVPVEPSDSSDESGPTVDPRVRDEATVEPRVYDVSVQLDTDRLPEGTELNARLLQADTSGSTETDGGDSEDGDPVPLPADWPTRADTAGGDSADGDPVPLPADPESEDKQDGSSEDGDPVPLPAAWFSGLHGTSSDGDSSGDDVETFEAEDTRLLVFSGIERPDGRIGSNLLVELTSPAWHSAMYLSVEE